MTRGYRTPRQFIAILEGRASLIYGFSVASFPFLYVFYYMLLCMGFLIINSIYAIIYYVLAIVYY